jgi:hypothetical protein
MEAEDVEQWFAAYLKVFGACGRGERPASEVVRFYSLPLLLTTDDIAIFLGSKEDIETWLRTQIDGMKAADFAEIDVLGSDVEVLNARTALLRGHFSRRRADGTEIVELTCTYLISDGPKGRAISALSVHSA